MNKILKIIAENKKILLSLFILPIFFFLLCLVYLSHGYFKQHLGLSKLKTLEFKTLSSMSKRKNIDAYIQKKTDSDPYFIDNNLETLAFLEDETKALDNLNSSVGFLKNFELKSRYDFLKKQNKLKFFEENTKTSLLTKETDESLINPIQINEKDLQKLLSIIEDIEINGFKPIDKAPQFIIKKFDLQKNKSCFSLDLKLVKREFTNPKKL